MDPDQLRRLRKWACQTSVKSAIMSSTNTCDTYKALFPDPPYNTSVELRYASHNNLIAD